MKENWSEEDSTWHLLEKAAGKKASAGFLDKTTRAVQNLPQTSQEKSKILHFSSWIALAACMALAALFLLKPKPTALASDQEYWEQIETVAEQEILLSRADDLESFSNQELLAIMGF